MPCKVCGKPVFQAIEGELICRDCRALADMSPEDIKAEEERRWFETHCNDCEKETPKSILKQTGGYCRKCHQELVNGYFL